MKKMPKSMGTMPKGKGGTGRTLDHPNCGKSATGGSKNQMPSTSHAGGKAHKSMGGGEGKKCKDPGVKCHAKGPQGKQAGGY